LFMLVNCVMPSPDSQSIAMFRFSWKIRAIHDFDKSNLLNNTVPGRKQ
jgi:hypothetical protein